MRLRCSAIVVAVLILGGCSSQDAADSPAVNGTPSAGNPASPPTKTVTETGLVGSWERLTTCRQRVAALEAAGLGEFAVEHAAGEGWLPGVDSPDHVKDPEHPCRGSVPLRHGHFFTDDGLFGSTDQDGGQVDDGEWTLVNDDTIVIHKEFGDVTMHFRVDGDSLHLDPVLPDCTDEGCFAAQWAVAVAYPGLAWTRVQ